MLVLIFPTSYFHYCLSQWEWVQSFTQQSHNQVQPVSIGYSQLSQVTTKVCQICLSQPKRHNLTTFQHNKKEQWRIWSHEAKAVIPKSSPNNGLASMVSLI